MNILRSLRQSKTRLRKSKICFRRNPFSSKDWIKRYKIRLLFFQIWCRNIRKVLRINKSNYLRNKHQLLIRKRQSLIKNYKLNPKFKELSSNNILCKKIDIDRNKFKNKKLSKKLKRLNQFKIKKIKLFLTLKYKINREIKKNRALKL